MKISIALIFFSLYFIPVNAQGILHTSGNKIVDATGHQVILRGVNLGGWLVTEDWMCGITDTTDSEGRSARKTLESIYSEPQVKQLMDTWENNWITSADMDTVQSLGFNFMRVPFGWRNLQYQNQQWYLDSTGNIDFSRFDWIVNQAAERNMYVLLDFHVWLDQDLAYNGISNTDSVIQSTCKIWKAVAAHFNNNATVAGYDLLNEPTGSYNNGVMQMIYDTVRSVDSAHIISIEWVNIDTTRWQNVLYQNHWYGLTDTTLAANELYFDTNYLPILLQADSLDVPYYIGETQVAEDSSYAWSLEQYCLHHTNWSPWTYKTVNEWGWGLISLYPNNVTVNLLTTPFDTIVSRWSQISNAGNWYELQNVKSIWSTAANCVNTVNSNQNILPVQAGFSLYPNPASTSLQLLSDAAFSGCSFRVINSLGQQITQGQLASQNQTINIEGWSAGVYFMLMDASPMVSLKFIKQ